MRKRLMAGLMAGGLMAAMLPGVVSASGEAPSWAGTAQPPDPCNDLTDFMGPASRLNVDASARFQGIIVPRLEATWSCEV